MLSPATTTADRRTPIGPAPASALPARIALWVLWLLWASFLLGGFAFGSLDETDANRIPLWCRMASSVTLVAAGVVWCAVARRTAAVSYTLLITAGMALGTLGDFFNAGLLDAIFPLPNPVLGGIAAFGLGHIAYISALMHAGNRAELNRPAPRYVSLVVWLLVGAVGWYLVAYTGTDESSRVLVWPALPYSLLLAATAGLGSGLAVQDRRFVLLGLGTALFLISDLILAFRLFHGPFRMGGDAVWLTYGPGQMLIVFAGSMAGIKRLGLKN